MKNKRMIFRLITKAKYITLRYEVKKLFKIYKQIKT